MKKNYSSIPKALPQRTCTVCRQVKGKKELVRLVRTPAGNVEIDKTGKKEGRGAYICTNPMCWEKIKKDKQLEHALKSNITPDNLKRIFENGTDLLKESGSG